MLLQLHSYYGTDRKSKSSSPHCTHLGYSILQRLNVTPQFVQLVQKVLRGSCRPDTTQWLTRHNLLTDQTQHSDWPDTTQWQDTTQWLTSHTTMTDQTQHNGWPDTTQWLTRHNTMTDQTQYTDWQHTTQLSTHNDWQHTTTDNTNTVTDNRAEVLVKQLITGGFNVLSTAQVVVADDRLYIVLFSAFRQTHCAHMWPSTSSTQYEQSTAPSGSIHMQNIFHMCTIRVNPHAIRLSRVYHQGQSTCKTSFTCVPSGSIHMQNIFHVCTTRVNPHTKLPSCPHHQGQPTYKTSLMPTPPGSIHIQNFLHVHTTRVNPHAKLLSCPYYQGQPTYKTSFMSVPSGSTNMQNKFHICTTRVNPHAKLLSCLKLCSTPNQKQVQTDQQYTHVNILDKRPLS